MNIIIGFIAIIVGIFNFIFPKKSWMIEGGFLSKSRKPSASTLKTRRVSGAVLILIGIYLLT